MWPPIGRSEVIFECKVFQLKKKMDDGKRTRATGPADRYHLPCLILSLIHTSTSSLFFPPEHLLPSSPPSYNLACAASTLRAASTLLERGRTTCLTGRVGAALATATGEDHHAARLPVATTAARWREAPSCCKEGNHPGCGEVTDSTAAASGALGRQSLVARRGYMDVVLQHASSSVFRC